MASGAFDEVGRLLTHAETPIFQAEDAKKGLIGLSRDLRGLAYAFNTKTSYMMLFDWIYPQYTNVMVRGVEIWCHDPQITTPVLKLFAELVQNRSQRLQFDVSSPNGILLFREASKVICTYGKLLLLYFFTNKQDWGVRNFLLTPIFDPSKICQNLYFRLPEKKLI